MLTQICRREFGGLPRAIMVLHTFGSDLKYHVHIHALVTFGGLDKSGTWRWPQSKKKLVGFLMICRMFRDMCLCEIEKFIKDESVGERWDAIVASLKKKQWCVHSERPTSNSEVVLAYLGRYICRIGLSINRFHYDAVHSQVTLGYKDYRNEDKQTGHIPIGSKKMDPLTAMHQILQHVLPLGFQKSRYYGLHANATQRKYRQQLPRGIQRNSETIRKLFELLKGMLGMQKMSCEQCKGDSFTIELIQADRQWLEEHVWRQNKDPTVRCSSAKKQTDASDGTVWVCHKSTKQAINKGELVL